MGKIFRSSLLLLLVLMVVSIASATDITVSSFQIPNYTGGGATAKIRLYSSASWTDSGGIPHLAGVIGSATGFYQEINCTVAGTTITVPSFVAPATQDSIDKPTVRITAVLFDSRGVKRDVLFSNWTIPATPTTTTWAALVTHNATKLTYPNDTYPTTPQVSVLISAAVGTLNDASDVVKGRTKLSVAPVSSTNPIAVGDNERINVVSYGVVGNCVADDTVAFQAAINAATDGSLVYKPKGLCMKISATINVTNKQGVTIRLSDVVDGYAHNTHDIEWAGATNSPVFYVKGSGGIVIEGGFLYSNIVGTGGVDIDSFGGVTSTSNIVRGMHFNFVKATAVSYGVRTHSTSNSNGERMQFRNIRCSFQPNVGSLTDVSNLTRGVCFKAGDIGGGFGQNVLNYSVEKSYWIGVSYGVQVENTGTNYFTDNESNYASVDYKLTPFSATSTLIENHRTESARQFLTLSATANVTVRNSEIRYGSWDATGTYPIIKIDTGTLILEGSGFASAHTPGVRYVVGASTARLISRGNGYLFANEAGMNADFTSFGYGASSQGDSGVSGRAGYGGTGVFNFYPIYYPGATGGQPKQGMFSTYDYLSGLFYPVFVLSASEKALEVASTRILLPQLDSTNGFSFGYGTPVAGRFALNSTFAIGVGVGFEYTLRRAGSGFLEFDGDQAGFDGFKFKKSVGINTDPVGGNANPRLNVNGTTQTNVLQLVATLFGNLGAPANGTFMYCSDCTVANPCAGAGTGALAKRLNGAWVCN